MPASKPGAHDSQADPIAAQADVDHGTSCRIMIKPTFGRAR
jgi:hypothetical protein